MHMPREPRARDLALVDPQVRARRLIGRAQRAQRPLGHRHELERLVRVQVLDRGDVTVRRDHQVPAVVRVSVEHREAPLAAKEDEARGVVTWARRRAEDALLLRAIALHVAQPPRRPEQLVRHGRGPRTRLRVVAVGTGW